MRWHALARAAGQSHTLLVPSSALSHVLSDVHGRLPALHPWDRDFPGKRLYCALEPACDMTRPQLIQQLVLGTICDDFENVEQIIFREVAELTSMSGFTCSAF